jgi:hypothetical protein
MKTNNDKNRKDEELTENEFEKKSKQYALDHIDDPIYKYLKTEQPNDFNFDTYLKVKLKVVDKQTHITLEDNHNIYTLLYFIVFVGEDCYSSGRQGNGESKSNRDFLIIKQDLTKKDIKIIAFITPRDENIGLLNMELDYKYLKV